MATTVRAKFQVNGINLRNGWQEMELGAVYEDTLNNEDHLFWKATPSGQIKLSITNPDASEFFQIGEKIYVDFTQADG